MKIFEIAIILIPKKSKDQNAEPATLLVKPTPVLAEDATQAQILGARMIPDEYATRLPEVTLAVRPF